jgi:hypothetical protein
MRYADGFQDPEAGHLLALSQPLEELHAQVAREGVVIPPRFDLGVKPGGDAIKSGVIDVQLVVVETVRQALQQRDARMFCCASMIDGQ